MKRLLAAGVLPLLILAAGACRRSGTPATGTPAADAPAAAGAAATPAPAAPAGAPSAPAQTPGVPPALPGAPAVPGAAPGAQPGAPPVKPVPAVLPAVLATVNGEAVQRWELEAALKQAEQAQGGPVPAAQRDSVMRGLLDELITY